MMDFKHVILPKVNRTENLQIMGVKLNFRMLCDDKFYSEDR